MKFAISAAVLSFAGLVTSLSVPRQNCPQATRFGVVRISPSNTSFKPGDEITVHVDFTCGINTFGIIPKALDYTIEVPVEFNNGHEPPIVLARRGGLQPGLFTDEFTTKIPHAFYFAGSPRNLVLTNSYAVDGTDGSEVIIQGGILTGIGIDA